LAVPLFITIRWASLKDLDTLCQIEKECFTSEAFTREQIGYLLMAPMGVSLVAEIGHKIVGFIIGLIQVYGDARIGYTYTLDVLTKHRRRGVASRLLEDLERIFIERGIQTCYLEVRTDNLAAQELYRKHGYTDVGVLKNYYGRGIQGIQLKKNLIVKGIK
jgi:ribosomal-protein-alanine N-acetyltransferase